MTNDEASSPAGKPEIAKRNSFSIFWIIPLIGLLLGAWLVKHSYDEKGEIIYVSFDNAEGLKAGKTEVRCRNVTIGLVENITLDSELHVQVEMRIKPEHLDLVRENSRFWVVRPRISGTNISGLNTLLSGSYVELDPGSGTPEKNDRRVFTGEEDPPLTPSSVPGLRLTLFSEEPGSVDVGSGIYFKGNLVGRVESRTFDPDKKETIFGIFVQEEYTGLVNSETRFWRDSGLELKIGSDGFQLDLPSFDALLSGGISFNIPENVPPGDPCPDGHRMPLYFDAEAAESSAFRSAAEFVLFLDQSVRGLAPGAPVEFRGLRVGRVKEISYQLVKGIENEKIPVLNQLNEHLL
ncbi:MAG: intermembrane transport protein PqiB, partial [Verrucomicrobiales bacterium]